MFCRIINNKIVEPSSFYGEKQFELSFQEFISKADGYYIYDKDVDNIIINPNFEIEQKEKENEVQKNELRKLIGELDIKRIRAVCEPSTKDTETGESWLEFYNNQIQDIRNQITILE